MSIQKFHKEVGFEENALEEIQALIEDMSELRYSNHAKKETIKERYQIIPVLKKNQIKLDDIFEYTRSDGKLIKFAIRNTKFSDKFDFSYSVSFDGTVITCWGNEKSDSHLTLDRSLYTEVIK